MRTLLIESSPGAGFSAAAVLREVGHDVVHCHAPGRSPFPCAEVERPGSCPLQGPDGVDVVLVARTALDRHPTLAEAGVSCATQAGVPVAVLGNPASNPFLGWTTSAIDADPVEACEQALAVAAAHMAAPLRAEVVRYLAAAGAPTTGTDVAVERHGDQVHVLVTVPHQSQRTHDSIATHVESQFRQTGPRTRIVDIAVRTTD